MNILLVNHKLNRCGVQQFGRTVYDILKKSDKFKLDYIEVDSTVSFYSQINRLNKIYNVILYNYHDQTMKWLDNNVTSTMFALGKKQFCLTGHDHTCHFHYTKNIIADPTGVDDESTYYTGRPIPFTEVNQQVNEIPTIGSFGFGFAQKNFSQILSLVSKQFDKAILRLHVPPNDFADPSGSGAMMADYALRSLGVKNVSIEISSDFKERAAMIQWLADNDLNIFLYDEQPGRGISSSIDFALAAGRPIAVNKSWMFKHIRDNSEILVDNNTLPSIIKKGVEPLVQYYLNWSNQNFIQKYEKIFKL